MKDSYHFVPNATTKRKVYLLFFSYNYVTMCFVCEFLINSIKCFILFCEFSASSFFRNLLSIALNCKSFELYRSIWLQGLERLLLEVGVYFISIWTNSCIFFSILVKFVAINQLLWKLEFCGIFFCYLSAVLISVLWNCSEFVFWTIFYFSFYCV